MVKAYQKLTPLSYSAPDRLSRPAMRNPDLLELEFTVIAFLMAVSLGYPAVRWLFAVVAGL
ncbi:hypothetical protein GCM10011371_26800 [Novosphingobium marinum]|uniref:Uncharacterized protein n=1 Tax=Novosphingobium marinum TaxID=1514948 RepID=A0A7Y9XUI0_9SPHN|nr:hypothetical protein [Novosphingobium marinum]NYH94705.1 hypothetical protein [Novosphingobium marinum]GGC38041.1 hypothetical protein GCM10011371_26800 [Novosphingobium marinum]